MGKTNRQLRAAYEARLKELDKQADILKLQKQVQEREIELGIRKPKKKVTWSKAMMVTVFLVCIEIIIYSEVVMYKSSDLSGLYSLIAAAASLFGTFWAYSVKSTAQNSKGGITYDMAMLQMQENAAPDIPEPAQEEEVAADDAVD